MKTFTVEIERDEAGYWIATVPDVPGVVTQAKQLSRILDRAREAIAALLDVDEQTFRVIPHVGALEDVPIADAVAARRRAVEAEDEARVKVGDVVWRLVHDKALTVRDTAELLDMSHQRVHQIIERRERELANA